MTIGTTSSVALSLATFLFGASASSTTAATGSARLPAVAARTVSVSDTAHLHYIARESEGSTLVEEGSASGQLPGAMRTRLNLGATFAGSFVLKTRGGAIIRGHGSARPSGSGRYESFRGSLVVTGGTGRYARVHGQAGLYGVFDRKTYELTIQTTGHLSY